MPWSNAVVTPAQIQHNLGIDLLNQNVEIIPAPADLLNQIYSLASISYAKSAAEAKRTVAALDFELLLASLPTLAPNFAPLHDVLTDFFSTAWLRRLRKLSARLMG
jgi:hypothetical protein